MLNNFDFYLSTKIYFGLGKENETGKILHERNASKVLIVIGRNSVIKSGLLNRVVKSLENENITYELIKGVRANPTFDLVLEGKNIVIEKEIDYILAIGGGSVIDTAKCIAVNAKYDGDIKDFNLHLATPTSKIPLGVILTISAAGSEMSNSCVIQDDDSGVKSGFNNELNRPEFAIMNPELTFSVDKKQTAYGVTDILMHTLERYFCKDNDYPYELADEFALGLIKNVIDVGLIAYNNPTDYEARARLMLASSFSHNGITSIGKKAFLTVHQIEHPLSGLFPNIAHGEGLAILFPAWADKCYAYDINKFARLGRYAFNITKGSEEEIAKLTVGAFREYFKKMDLPLTLSEVGVKEKDIDKLVDSATRKGSGVVPHHTLPMDEKVIREIYLRAL